MILTGGLRDARHTSRCLRADGCGRRDARTRLAWQPVALQELVEGRAAEPSPEEVLDELDWVMDRAAEHLGAPRAARYLRKFYPWYLARLTSASMPRAP